MFSCRSEESSELLLEKSHISDEESRLLTQKALEAEKELQRMKLLSSKTQDEKLMLEQKVKETELLVSKLLKDGEKRSDESDRLKSSLLGSRLAEKQAKEKLLEFVETFKNSIQQSDVNGGGANQLGSTSFYGSTPFIMPPSYQSYERYCFCVIFLYIPLCLERQSNHWWYSFMIIIVTHVKNFPFKITGKHFSQMKTYLQFQ